MIRINHWSAAGVAALLLAACGDDGATTGTGGEGAGGGVTTTDTTTSSQSSGGGGQSGGEDCANGLDDDADDSVDCADSDCTTDCQDTCGVAQTVLDPSITMGSTAGYGDSTDGSCATAAGGEHVYQVTATKTGEMTVKVVSFSDMAVSVRSACADVMTEVGCSNVTSGSGDETVALGVTAGETYFIVVEGGTMASDFQLEVSTAENVACSTAATLSDPGTVMGATSGATSYLDPLPLAMGGQCPDNPMAAAEKVFVVTAAANGVLEASLDANYDAVLYLRKGCLDTTGERCTDKPFDMGMPAPEKTAIAVAQGDTVYVIVDGWQAGTGNFTLHVASRPVVCGDGILDPGEACEDAGANDGCSAMCTVEACDSPIAASEGTVQGNLAGGPPGFVDTSCQPDPKSPEDVYEIIANETGTMVVTTTATSPTDVGVEVRTDCADPTTVLGCNDPAPPSPDKVGVSVVQGQSYLVVVKSFTPGSAGPYSLNIDIHQPACGDGFTEGMEQCDDGDVTSGDGCSATCTNEATSCMAPIVLSDPSTDTFSIGMPADSVTTCNLGGDVVFSFVADQTGVLDVVTAPNVGVAIRPTCNDMTGELRCTVGSTSVPVTAGQTYFIIASPLSPPAPGATFPLSVSTRVPECGDGIKDIGEDCDDANMDNTDGCTDQCVLVVSETESNDSPMTADAFVAPFTGVISPQADVDYIAVVVPGPASTITATVVDGPVTSCGQTLPRIDSLLTLFGTNGTTQLAFNDDIMLPTNFCSSVTASNLPAGTYYLQVKAFGMTPGFDYGLEVTVN